MLAALDAPLRETGDGTVAFEFAGSAERSAEIVAAWRGEGVVETAAFINGLDFLFAPLYAAAIAGACLAGAPVRALWRCGGANTAVSSERPMTRFATPRPHTASAGARVSSAR